MVLLDKLIDYFCDHAAVVNEDENALKREVEIVKRKYGPWFRVKGFTDYKSLFLALHLADARKNPFSIAFIHGQDYSAGELVIKKSIPSLKTYKYSDTQNLLTLLPPLR